MRSKSSAPDGRSIRAPLGFACAFVLAALAPAAAARADGFDTTTPHVLRVGEPRGASPVARVSSSRTGRSRTPLPRTAAEVWSHHVVGNLEQAPVVDETGALIVALGVPDIVKISRDGTEVFRARIGPQAAAAPPVLTSDGNIVVMTAGGTAVGLSSAGVLRFTTSLIAKSKEESAAPVARRDGGVVIAASHTLFDLGEDGSVRARATLDERPVGDLVEGPDATLAIGESGAVYAWRPPALPKRLGSFGGNVRRGSTGGAALADAHTLLAVVDGRRLVALDLATGAVETRATATPATGFFDGPPAVGLELVYAASQSGLLIGVDMRGNERIAVQIDKIAPSTTALAAPTGGFAMGAFLGASDARPSPPVIVDDTGRVAFVRADGRVGLVSSDGAVVNVTDRACLGPLAIFPAGERRFVVACRDGNLVEFGE